MFIEYVNRCPECQKENQSMALGFDSELGKIRCEGFPQHFFENLPGEPEPVVADLRPGETPELQPQPAEEMREWTPEEEAELNAQMAKAPRRDFGSMVAPDLTDSTAAAAAESICASDEAGIVCGQPRDAHTRDAAQGDVGMDHPFVPAGEPAVSLVSEGAAVTLPNADVLVGVRIAEYAVSPLQAEAESQGKTLAAYVQELVDMGMMQWNMAAPDPR